MDIPRDEEEYGNVPDWTNMGYWGEPYEEWDEEFFEQMDYYMALEEYNAATKIQRAWLRFKN